jgi:membrane protein DedA with SNARE-associated domain
MNTLNFLTIVLGIVLGWPIGYYLGFMFAEYKNNKEWDARMKGWLKELKPTTIAREGMSDDEQ